MFSEDFGSICVCQCVVRQDEKRWINGEKIVMEWIEVSGQKKMENESEDKGWQMVSTCNYKNKWMINGWDEWDLTKKEDEGE